MMAGEPSAGTPAASSQNVLRDIIDRALLHSGAPGSLDSTSGGVLPSRMLGDFLEQALRGLYDVTAGRADVQTWLADALGVRNPAGDDVMLALARLLDASGYEPGNEFDVPFMSAEEDKEDSAVSQRAIVSFGTIPDGLPKETS